MERVEIQQLAPGRSDRVFLAGQTGSGKTTLAQQLLLLRRYVVVLDVKGTLNWSGYFRVTKFSELLNLDPVESPRVIYAPRYEELSDSEQVNDFFRWVYDRHNCTVYVDELAGVTSGDSYPYYYGACLMRGRELGVEVWSGSQRPTRIPQIAMSEAEHVYCFKLKMTQDRQRMESLAEIPQEKIAALPKQHFLYAPQDGGVIGPLKLAL